MQDEIRPFLLGLLEKKSGTRKNFDEEMDFIKEGIIYSIGIIKFILEIEHKFNIEITDSDIESNDFRSILGLTKMIEKKLN